MRWFISILLITIGFILMLYYRKITEMIGMKIGWAEKFLGAGGTYYAYLIFGIVAFALGLLLISGVVDLAWFGWA